MRYRSLSATVGLALAMSWGAQLALGQFPQAQQGNALDANTRIGSGGINAPGNPNILNNGVTGNRIVTGNVTGGREFRPGVPYTDPRELRVALPSGNIDNFIKNSVSAPPAYQSPVFPGQIQAFYGSQLAEAPPAGFVQRGFTGTYTPPPNPLGYDRPAQGPLLSSGPFLLTPLTNEVLLQGPLDPATNQPTLLSASPLLGLRRWDMGQLPNLASTPAANSPQQTNVLDRMRLDPAAVQQLRDELLKATGQNPPQPGNNQPAEPTSSNNLAQPVPTPFETPENRSIGGKPLNNSIGNPALGAGAGPQPGIGSRLWIPGPAQQSAQYAELQRRLDRYYVSRMQTDEDRYRDFLKQLRAKEAAEKPAGPTETTEQPAANTNATVLPDYARMSQELLTAPARQGPAAPQTRPTFKPQPVQVKSLATGVKAKGLADVLRAAEELMRQGKYDSAIERYAQAERAIPNNPLIWLGKAHAELAGGYYRRAEQDLRQAVTHDPSLTMGQYDLKEMIGQQRLELLVKDLKDTAKRQDNDPGPVLLLAYLAYNTGNSTSAAMYLGEAEKRSGSRDTFCKLLRLHWSLPGDQGASIEQTNPTLPLSDVLKQFEDGNILSATMTSSQLRGEFRSAVVVADKSYKSFNVELPAGAASGPLGKWIQDHRQGAELKLAEVIAPTTRP